ncbi:MAG: tRNA threonylcarbamoyladenosine dehydratase [Candidatus Methanomethylophilaceae archaeon]|nr:tRNA threonylcarbamoyladenosine dehydratase [Candidatus Methanomethylophilaceae archaeon]MBP5685618.1 tRNA threonylcarbamoyladenosine dehydratase [Candidatus Methanomethylophilaceae archaeon]MBP5735458.1 tRNA threonylcarbamoyladenosine dehydratase [Candidatus Methanomethylophilaceae archaeon]
MSGMSERTSLLIGEAGVERLRNSSVLLVGCGAVGGYALEGLVRAGVGKIRVVDHDVFSESNMNRQILATTNTVGVPKVEAACERAKSINPEIQIEPLDILVNPETVSEILDGDFDILVDAIDTLGNKIALLSAASDKGIVTFSSMGAALHIDTQSVKIAPLMKTNTCPLAASLRKALRDKDTSKITAVYSVEPPVVKPSERDVHGKSILGSLPTVPAVFGMTLANEAIKYILSRES